MTLCVWHNCSSRPGYIQLVKNVVFGGSKSCHLGILPVMEDGRSGLDLDDPAGGVAMVGTTAEVCSCDDRGDREMVIKARGRQRFRILPRSSSSSSLPGGGYVPMTGAGSVGLGELAGAGTVRLEGAVAWARCEILPERCPMPLSQTLPRPLKRPRSLSHAGSSPDQRPPGGQRMHRSGVRWSVHAHPTWVWKQFDPESLVLRARRLLDLYGPASSIPCSWCLRMGLPGRIRWTGT